MPNQDNYSRPHIRPIYDIPLERFIQSGGKTTMASAEFCEGMGKTMSERAFKKIQEQADELFPHRGPTHVPGFSIAHTGNDWVGGVICIWEDVSGRVVGGQSGGIPYVDPDYRGIKLGREIQLKAFETGLKTLQDLVFFSPEGLAARKSAHRFAVENALERGIDVPGDVLESYPELLQARAPSPF